MDRGTMGEGRDPHGQSQREAHCDLYPAPHSQGYCCAGSWRKLSSISTAGASTNNVTPPILNLTVKTIVDLSTTVPQLPP